MSEREVDYCEDCGCKVFDGKCVNCHEEIYIYEQNQSNDEPAEMSQEFLDKVREQEAEIKRQKKIKAEM